MRSGQRRGFPPPAAGHIGSVPMCRSAPRHVRSVTNVLAEPNPWNYRGAFSALAAHRR
jgi:hypothetical protein